MKKFFVGICLFILLSSFSSAFAGTVTKNGREYVGLITVPEKETSLFYVDNVTGCSKDNSKIVFISLYEEDSRLFYLWDYKNDERIRDTETVKNDHHKIKYVLTKIGENQVLLVITHETIDIPGKQASMKIIKATGKTRKIWPCPESVSYVVWDEKKYNQIPVVYKDQLNKYRNIVLGK